MERCPICNGEKRSGDHDWPECVRTLKAEREVVNLQVSDLEKKNKRLLDEFVPMTCTCCGKNVLECCEAGCPGDLKRQVRDLRRLMGHWSTVDLALKWQNQVMEDLDAANRQVREMEEARQVLWGKLVMSILDRGGKARIDKNIAELTDLSKYELAEWTDDWSREYVMEVREKGSAQKPRPEVCGTWVIGVGPCCATLPCVHHPRQAEKREREAPVQCPHGAYHQKGVGSCSACRDEGVPRS